MKRRKNADDKIRKLQRAAASGDIGDVVNYWRAALAADILPEPTAEDAYGVVWFAGEPVREGIYYGNDFGMVFWNNKTNNMIGTRREGGLWAGANAVAEGRVAEEEIKKRLRQLLSERANPRKKRRNADDRLRRLERIALTTREPTDVVAYWKECIRTRTKPSPTNDFYGQEVYTLFPVDYDKQKIIGRVSVERMLQDMTQKEIFYIGGMESFDWIRGLKFLMATYETT